MRSPDGLRDCSTYRNHQRIALSGRRTSTLYLENPKQINLEQIEVDGCAITDGKRCDWLVRVVDVPPKEEIFVELKGSGVLDAVQQLRETIATLSVQKNTHPKRAVIVFTRNPMTGTDIQIQQAKFLKDFNAKLLMVKDNSQISV